MSGPTVLIMAGGKGTRMRSPLPKVMHPVCGRPMLAWTVDAARAAGAGRIVAIVPPDGDLSDALEPGVETAVQPQADGTGGAVRCAAAAIEPDADVLVVSGDNPALTGSLLEGVIDDHRASGAAATMATMILDDPVGYGRVVRTAGGDVERVVETKAAGDADPAHLQIREVNAGLYAFAGGALLEALERIDNDNAQGEYYLPDVLPAMRGAGLRVAASVVEDPEPLTGVNTRADLAVAAGIVQRRIQRRLMESGVAIIDPRTTWIEADVVCEPDATIEPHCTLRGRTRIGARATIGPSSTLTDAVVEDGAAVRASWLVACRVGPGAEVGPYSYLRPDAVLAEGAKTGAFVEVKNSRIGPGAKVPHLSYVGDADVGEKANLGASTITANYDGRNKHRTEIGAGARTGVHTSLVAPVRVGDGAYTGAGSTIVHDVPDGDLGVARARQRIVEGYAARAAPPEEGESRP